MNGSARLFFLALNAPTIRVAGPLHGRPTYIYRALLKYIGNKLLLETLCTLVETLLFRLKLQRRCDSHFPSAPLRLS